MIKRTLLSLTLLCSFNAIGSVPTVSDVESVISKGDYDKAKVQIKEVLKANPDSIVANNYMLEVLKLEYAGSLVPSVEYKIYENNLIQIKKQLAEKARIEQVLKEEKERKETWKSFFKGITYFLLTIILFGSLFVLYKFYSKRKLEKQLKEQKDKWLADSNNKFIYINTALSNYLNNKNLSAADRQDAINLLEDNSEALEAVRLNSDFNKSLVNKHFNDSFDWLRDKGLL